MPPCPRLCVSSMDTLQSAGFLPLKLVFSTVLFGDELDSHCTSTLHCLENRGTARLISVLASGLLGYCGCGQPMVFTSVWFISLLEAKGYAAWFIWRNWVTPLPLKKTNKLRSDCISTGKSHSANDHWSNLSSHCATLWLIMCVCVECCYHTISMQKPRSVVQFPTRTLKIF